MMVKSGLLCVVILCVLGRLVDGGAMNQELAKELRQVLRDLNQQGVLNNERRAEPTVSSPTESSPPEENAAVNAEEQRRRNEIIDEIIRFNRANLETLSTAELEELLTEQEEEFGGVSIGGDEDNDNTSDMTGEDLGGMTTEEEELEALKEEDTDAKLETKRSQVENTKMDEGELAARMKKEGVLTLLKRWLERK